MTHSVLINAKVTEVAQLNALFRASLKVFQAIKLKLTNPTKYSASRTHANLHDAANLLGGHYQSLR
jgi:hypothetical protein